MDRGEAGAAAAYALGALSLASEAAVHVQQYASVLHEVRWVGPLFLANAAASIVTIIGLGYWRTRALAALAGVVISALALGSLVVSYGHGLFGWQEGGFRMAVAIALTTEMCAAILLSAALTTVAVRSHPHYAKVPATAALSMRERLCRWGSPFSSQKEAT